MSLRSSIACHCEPFSKRTVEKAKQSTCGLQAKPVECPTTSPRLPRRPSNRRAPRNDRFKETGGTSRPQFQTASGGHHPPHLAESLLKRGRIYPHEDKWEGGGWSEVYAYYR